MHIGNAYAAIAAWLAARSAQGVVRLRIEDIDADRVRADADRWIMDDLHWLGIDWDGPVIYQSQRIDNYHRIFTLLQHSFLLDEEGTHPQALVYPCFCSRADLKAASAPNEGDGFRIYNRRCRSLSAGETSRRIACGERHAWRIAVPEHAESASAHINECDEVFGSRSLNLCTDNGDTVIRRSDGMFAYQFVTSIDDMAMGVNQIVRGRDLLSSTAIQAWIARQVVHISPDIVAASASGQSISLPHVDYAHLPLICDEHGRRLAKRDADMDVGMLRAHHVEAQTVVGLCAYWMGLITSPHPMKLNDLVDSFSWEWLSHHHQDIHVDLRRVLDL